jgi:hypothetical protein
MLSVVLVVVVVIVVVVVVAIVDVVVLVVTVVVVSHERVSWSSTPSHSPLTLQHAKYSGLSPCGLLISKSVSALGAQKLRRSKHWPLRQARRHFGSASVSPLQLSTQSDWQLAVIRAMHAFWQSEPSGDGGTVPPVVVLVVVVVVAVVVVAVLPVPVVVLVVVVLVTVVDAVVVVVVVVVDVLVLVVDVVVGAAQKHSRLRRHCRRALLAAATALRPHRRRALVLNVVQERLMESTRVRRHLLSALMVRVQLPGRPGACAAQTPYCTLKSCVRSSRFVMRSSASAQSSTSVSVRS